MEAVTYGVDKVEEDLNDELQDRRLSISISETRTALNILQSLIDQCCNVDDEIDIENMNCFVLCYELTFV